MNKKIIYSIYIDHLKYQCAIKDILLDAKRHVCLLEGRLQMAPDSGVRHMIEEILDESREFVESVEPYLIK